MRIWIGFDVLCSRFNWIVVSSSAKLNSFMTNMESFLLFWVNLNWIVRGMMLHQLNWKALWFFMSHLASWRWLRSVFVFCDSWKMFPLYCGASTLHQSAISPALIGLLLWAEKVLLSANFRCILLLFGVGKTLCLSLQHVLFFFLLVFRCFQGPSWLFTCGEDDQV